VDQKIKYIKKITNSFIFSFGMLKHLPSLFFWGVRVKALTQESSTVTIKHGWTNKNPFGSIYFSALAGAAELSTGILVQLHIQGNASYSMLVVESTAQFLKKAKGTILFICDQGSLVQQSIDQLNVHEPSNSFVLHSKAIDESGIEVGHFTFTWSVKKK
jgi:hypothetical protein